MIRPSGSWVAIVTPFMPDGTVDYEGFQTLIDFQIAHGTDGVLVMGSTGEATSLSIAERREIITRVVPMAKGRIPTFVGTTAGTTAETVALSEHAAKANADGLLLVVPPYIQPPQDGVYNHFKAVADAIPCRSRSTTTPRASASTLTRRRLQNSLSFQTWSPTKRRWVTSASLARCGG